MILVGPKREVEACNYGKGAQHDRSELLRVDRGEKIYEDCCRDAAGRSFSADEATVSILILRRANGQSEVKNTCRKGLRMLHQRCGGCEANGEPQ
jgi:hypothetical protein